MRINFYEAVLSEDDRTMLVSDSYLSFKEEKIL